MTHEEFENLVGRLDVQARSDPPRYRRRVIFLALVGYAYLAFVLALLLGLTALALLSIAYLKILGVKLAIAIGAFLWFVMKALWVRIPAPEGITVGKRDAPKLIDMVERLTTALHAPAFHTIIIDNRLNASVVQVPRLGIFGWHRNYLTVGLPMMQVLTPQQLEAVIAHELGHLAGGHGRLSNWIYRLRFGWERLLQALTFQRSFATFLFKPFFTRYAPYFHAYSFPLARANEYEADAASARLTSTRSAAAALTTVEVMGAYLEKEFWPSLHKEVADLPRPNFRPASVLSERLAAGVPAEAEKEWLAGALQRKSTIDDTHPSLSDRLAAIGEAPLIEHPAPGMAADQLLGASREKIARQLDDQWTAGILPAWEKTHMQVQGDRKRFAELQAVRHEGTALDAAQLHDLATLTESVAEDDVAALALFREAQSTYPGDAAANFSLGLRLLKANDDSGIALVERAMQLDSAYTRAGTQVLRDYAWRKGDTETAKQWHGKLTETVTAHEAAEEERSIIRTSDKFERHGLDRAVIDRLSRDLAAVGVRKAWIARKRTKHNSDTPLYVLGIISTSFWKFSREEETRAIQQEIFRRVELPQETVILSLEGNSQFISKYRWKKARVV
jgi:Zn-dependent protease with chaperone function